MIVQNISRDGYTDISFTLPRGDRARAERGAASEVARAIGAPRASSHDERVAKVSIVGVGMRSHSGVAARMFAALSRGEHQHPDDLDLRDRRLVRHRGQVHRARRAARSTTRSSSAEDRGA